MLEQKLTDKSKKLLDRITSIDDMDILEYITSFRWFGWVFCGAILLHSMFG